MHILLFEDELVAQLFPANLSRPTYAINCGGWRLIDLVKSLSGNVSGMVRPHLEPLQADYEVRSLDQLSTNEACLFVNARTVPSLAAWKILKSLMDQDVSMMIDNHAHVAATLLTTETRKLAAAHSVGNIPQHLRDLQQEQNIPVHPQKLPLLEWPHNLIRYQVELLGSFLQHRIAVDPFKQLSDGLFVGKNVTIGDQAIFDTSGGPIVIEDSATVGPQAYVEGPTQIGANAQVLCHAKIKSGVTLGHNTKVGGEVAASTIEPYSNKQHHGYLGHSYIGSWVNLGAGTCNSNLKNTYGEISMQYGEQRVATGMQFLGMVVGDYVKSAINTSIFTGKTIGCCSTLYGFITENVGAFVNYAKSLGSVTEMSVEVLLKGQAKMFSRRGVEQRACDRQLVADMFDITNQQRAGLPSSPPTFLK